eukprot:6173319-Pleurochrysis_carterae.AAC.1
MLAQWLKASGWPRSLDFTSSSESFNRSFSKPFAKLGKQTFASLCDDKEKIRLLNNWAEGIFSLEDPDTEHSSDDLDDSEDDEFGELSLEESEDDEDDERPHPEPPKGKTKQVESRTGSQRGKVQWATVTDEDSFQAQAGSSYEDYVKPEARTSMASNICRTK